MQVVFVGAGYVADYYISNMRSHPEFTLCGVFDRDPHRLAAFAGHYGVRALGSLDEALTAPGVGMVLNLTNPRSHYEVTAAALRAGKHVYSEKPMAIDSEEAASLARLADDCGVRLGVAPCHVLSESVCELSRAIADGAIGEPTLAYINFDDGMIAPHEKPWTWLSASGAPWPAKDEFEIGCTYEHAGYCLSVLAGLFGPARAMTAFASHHVGDKGIPLEVKTPDFSLGAIEYDHGIVARVTIGLVAPHDKSLTVVGSHGSLRIRHLRDDRHAIEITNTRGARHFIRRAGRRMGVDVRDFGRWRIHSRPKGPKFAQAAPRNPVDYFRGPQEMLDAIRQSRPHRLSADLGVHLTELTETLQYPERFNFHRRINSSFAPLRLLEA